MLEGLLGWSREDYIASIDPKSSLCILAQNHHDEIPMVTHNLHNLYKSESDAQSGRNLSGFIIVSSQCVPQGEIKESMHLENEPR